MSMENTLKLKTLALALVASFLAASASAAPLVVGAGAGKVSVMTADGPVVLQPGDSVPAGAQVTVTGGGASFSAGGVTVNVPAGGGFKYAEGKNGVEVTASAGNVSVAAGKSVATLAPGAAIAVKTDAKATTIAVLAGSVPVATNGKTQTVSKGNQLVGPPASTGGKAPDSIPADVVTAVTVTPIQQGSPTQETNTTNNNTCTATVSPSAPCP